MSLSYRALQADPRLYRHLDAAQLVKHYLGLRNTFPGRNVTLLYLFWEPTNAADFPEFRRHRDEIATFAESTSVSAVHFIAMSHPELWTEWETLEKPAWLGGHVAYLRARYEVAI